MFKHFPLGIHSAQCFTWTSRLRWLMIPIFTYSSDITPARRYICTAPSGVTHFVN